MPKQPTAPAPTALVPRAFRSRPMPLRGLWWAGALLLVLAGALSAAAPAEAEPARVLGNPQAPLGGVRRESFSVQPATLHPLNATDAYGNRILESIYESLTEVDLETYDSIPLLAERWEVSDDKRTFTFHLNPAARWSDGKPVTAEDVKFSFDVLKHKQLRTRAKWSSYYANFDKAQVLDERTVRFTATVDHFLNFERLGTMRNVPKAYFAGDDPNKTALTKTPVGSGPLLFKEWKKGTWIRLARNEHYWGGELPQKRGFYNQKTYLVKFIPTDKVVLESFKKGDLDLVAFTPEQWVRETDSEAFGDDRKSGKPLIKLAVDNLSPRSYNYVGYNLESPLFADRRVRRAMAHLYDRNTFIEKFYFGFRDKTVGPFAANSPYSSPQVRPIEYDIPKAIELLAAAGWRDTNGDNLLDKDGRTFSFTVLTADQETSVKVLTLAKESMRQAGVELNIKVVDWSTLLQLIDEYKFDAVMLGWTREVHSDPTALWHSSAAVRGGLNFVHYRNPEVDRLIEAGVKTIPEAERVKIYRRIHELIYDDQPYTFLLEPNRRLYGYQSKLRFVKPWYAYDVGFEYWWFAK